MASRTEIVRQKIATPERPDSIPDVRQHRLTGEDAPIGASIALGVLGAAFALVAGLSVDTPGVHFVDTKRWLQMESEEVKLAPAEPAVEAAPQLRQDASLHTVERQDRLVKSPAERAALAEPQHVSAPTRSAPPELIECPRAFEISFPFGSSHLESRKSGVVLKKLADWVVKHNGAIVSVEGRVDPTGNERRNVFLSLRRARTVAEQLSAAGLDERRMVVRVAGPNQSGAASQTPSRERRVMLNIEGVSNCRPGGVAMGQE